MKYYISLLLLFLSYFATGQKVNQLYPCRDNTGALVSGCIPVTMSNGRYLEVRQDTGYCIGENYIVEYVAANSRFGIAQGNLAYSQVLPGACTANETILDALTPDYINGLLTYTNTGGISNVIDVCRMVDSCETVTTVLYNPLDHTIVYNDENGNPNTLDLNVGDLAYNPATNSLDYTAEDGGMVNLTLNSIAVADLIAGNRIATITDELGTVYEVDETITSLVSSIDVADPQNPVITITYTNEDGSNADQMVTIPIPASVASSLTQIVTTGNQIASHDDGQGGVTTIFETVTSSTYDAANHTITYTDEAGTPVALDLDVGAVAYNPATNVIAYTAEDGTLTTLTLNNIGLANLIAGNRITTITDELGNSFDIDETVTTLASSIDLTDPSNPILEINYTNEDGSNVLQSVTIPIPPGAISALTQTITSGNQIASHADGQGNVVDIFETITTATYDATAHTITYTDEAGNPTTLTLDNGTIAYNPATNVVTYTAEDGTVTNLTLNNIGVANLIAGNRIATITDELGNAFDVDETVTSLSTSIDLTDPQNPVLEVDYTNEDGSNALQSVTIPIPAGAISALTQTITSGNQIASHSDGQGGTTVIFETVTGAAYNSTDHEVTYTAEDGTPTTLDLNVGTAAFNPATNVLTYTAPDGTVTNLTLNNVSVTNTITGNTIATITNELGVAVDVDETVTTIDTIDGGVGNADTLVYTNEAGVVVSIPFQSESIPFAFSIIDEDGRTYPVTDATTITLDNDLHVGPDGGNTEAIKIGTSAIHSDQAATGTETNSHTAVVVGGEDAFANAVRTLAQGHSQVTPASSVSFGGAPGSNTINNPNVTLRPTYLNQITGGLTLNNISGGGDNLIANSIANGIGSGAHHTILDGAGHNYIAGGSSTALLTSAYSFGLGGLTNTGSGLLYSGLLGGRGLTGTNLTQATLTAALNETFTNSTNSFGAGILRSNGLGADDLNQVIFGAYSNSQLTNINNSAVMGFAASVIGTAANVVEFSLLGGGFSNDYAQVGALRYSGSAGGRDIVMEGGSYLSNGGGQRVTFSNGIVHSANQGGLDINISGSRAANQGGNLITLSGENTANSGGNNKIISGLESGSTAGNSLTVSASQSVADGGNGNVVQGLTRNIIDGGLDNTISAGSDKTITASTNSTDASTGTANFIAATATGNITDLTANAAIIASTITDISITNPVNANIVAAIATSDTDITEGNGTAVIGGQGITASQARTVYVPNLAINQGIGISGIPANSADGVGIIGQINFDNTFLYIKTPDGQWKRVALSTF